MPASIKASIALALLVACGGGKDEIGKDWSGVPIDTAVTSHIGNVPFDIKLPAGWKADESDTSDVSRGWRPDVHDYFSEPSVTVLKESIPTEDLGRVRGERDAR